MTTTRYDRMRAAATTLREFDVRPELAHQLRADADELEAVEKDLRNPYADPTMGVLAFYADRIRGEK